MGTNFGLVQAPTPLCVHTPLRSDRDRHSTVPECCPIPVHTPLRSDGDAQIYDYMARLELFTLHSGQIGTRRANGHPYSVLQFTLHSGQMRTKLSYDGKLGSILVHTPPRSDKDAGWYRSKVLCRVGLHSTQVR